MDNLKHRPFTTAPIEVPPLVEAGTIRPEFLRLPKPGQLCAHTGLTRSALNALILPMPENDFKPPVRSFTLRRRGAAKGIRLIDYESLREYIRARPQT